MIKNDERKAVNIFLDFELWKAVKVYSAKNNIYMNTIYCDALKDYLTKRGVRL